VPIELAAREWRLLEYLARRLGEVVPRAEIEAHIYDELVEPMSNVVDTAIYTLRQKVGAGFIHTRRGLGYVMEAIDE
jgi:DNA-binding response OmpR family regulator